MMMFTKSYPNIAKWVEAWGWVEIGNNDDSPLGFVLALTIGGVIWEGKHKYDSLEDALEDLNRGIGKWLEIHE
jgi:hypothetical protein